MSKPTDDPQAWADDASADKVDPSTFAAVGFVEDDPARYDWLNWVLNNFGEWLDFLRTGGGVIAVWPATLGWWLADSDQSFENTAVNRVTVTDSRGSGPLQLRAAGMVGPIPVWGTVTQVRLRIDTVTGTPSITPVLRWSTGSGTTTNAAVMSTASLSSADDGTVVTMTYSGTLSDDIQSPPMLEIQVSTAAGDAVEFGRAFIDVT